MPAHGYANLNGAAQRVGSAQKPSSRAYSGALPRLRSNAYVGRPGCMDRTRAALARSTTPQRISRGILECIGQRWRDDAETAWRGEISSKKKLRGVSYSARGGIVGPKPNRSPSRISRGPSGLEIGDATCHIAPMGQPQRDYRYRLRKYPRRHGVVWRWFIFEGDSGPVQTGIIL